MKLCIDLTSLADHFSGVERYASSLTKAIIKDNKTNCILLFKGQVHPLFWVYEKHPRVRMVVLREGCSKVLFNQVTLLRAIRLIKADAYLFPGFPMPILCQRRDCFAVIHDVACFDEGKTMRLLQRWYYQLSRLHEARRAKQIFTISDFSMSRIFKKLPLANPEILNISCGIDDAYLSYQREACEIQTMRKKYRIPENYLLSLSTLEPRKNLKALVLAYDALVRGGKKLPPLVLAGRKGWRMLDFLKGISPEAREKIYITGFVEEEDLPSLYGGACGFVFPSIYEGFGIPPVEAMACGCPVLASNARALKEVLKDAVIYFKLQDGQDGLKKGLLSLVRLSGGEKDARIRRGKELAGKYRYQDVAEKALASMRRAKGYSC
ncbi:MAG: glycosyltransferase family 4 protein [Lachnospiraceae bacterium]|nr:glycosyltransferase family 4 protein [Lachnospiraceae bacterium]